MANIKDINSEKVKKPVKRAPRPKIKLNKDPSSLKKLKLVIVAYSHVEREWFPTDDAYYAELEVEDRAKEVAKEVEKLGVPVKAIPGDQYFLTNLLVDKPDLVLNLVDTLRGKDRLQISVPAALELANIPYTGAAMEGMVIGNNRNLTKRVMMAYNIPNPPFQFCRRANMEIDEELGLPLIVKLNEGGGSVGIDDHAVKETFEYAQKRAAKMIQTYHLPIVIEKFIDGPEITVCVFDDGKKKHVLMGEKVFRRKPDGKHYFTSIDSYEDERAYKYRIVDDHMKDKITALAVRAFNALHHKDYAKFDVRVDSDTKTPYFTDSNPNTAFGPDLGLPFTEVFSLYNIPFSDILTSLLSKYAKSIPQ